MNMSEHVKTWTSTFNSTGKMLAANMFPAQGSVTNTLGRTVGKKDIDIRKGRDWVFRSWETGGKGGRVGGRIVAIDVSSVWECPAAEFGLVG